MISFTVEFFCDTDVFPLLPKATFLFDLCLSEPLNAERGPSPTDVSRFDEQGLRPATDLRSFTFESPRPCFLFLPSLLTRRRAVTNPPSSIAFTPCSAPSFDLAFAFFWTYVPFFFSLDK